MSSKKVSRSIPATVTYCRGVGRHVDKERDADVGHAGAEVVVDIVLRLAVDGEGEVDFEVAAEQAVVDGRDVDAVDRQAVLAAGLGSAILAVPVRRRACGAATTATATIITTHGHSFAICCRHLDADTYYARAETGNDDP